MIDIDSPHFLRRVLVADAATCLATGANRRIRRRGSRTRNEIEVAGQFVVCGLVAQRRAWTLAFKPAVFLPRAKTKKPRSISEAF